MAFNLSDWLMRKRIGAEVRYADRPVEHRRVGNPFHAVSVEPGLRACEAARKLEGRRFLSSSAPTLPVPECSRSKCQCRYVHHNDRRSARDRRVNFANPHAHKMSDRRGGCGRRMTD